MTVINFQLEKTLAISASDAFVTEQALRDVTRLMDHLPDQLTSELRCSAEEERFSQQARVMLGHNSQYASS